jgi:hypothetical protein
MTYPNPDYDPNWKARHDAHAVERDRAEREKTRLIEAGQMMSDAYAEARARWKKHHAECLAAIIAQHKTVQDYAAWRFQSAPPNTGFQDASVLLPVVDFASLRTIEEANAAWHRLHDIAQAAALDQRGSLPIGQPPGLVAFADATAPGLYRYWREFTAQDLYPGPYARGMGALTLMTVDEQADGRHICFMHKWGSPGISVTNAIEPLATAVYREACAIAAGQPATRSGWLERLMGRKPALMDPARFHFYEHTPPAPGGTLREDFARVELTFEEGVFRKPDWQHFRVIPHAIQSARFDLAAEGAGMRNPVRPVITDERPGA